MFQIESGTQRIVLRVQCEIDFSVAAEFNDVLLLASSNSSLPLVVSLEECTFMDCAGLSVLLNIRKLSHVPMSVVVRDDSFLRRLFSIAGLAKWLNVTDGCAPVIAA